MRLVASIIISLSNWTSDNSAAVLPRNLSNFSATGHFQTQSCDFECLWDLTIKTDCWYRTLFVAFCSALVLVVDRCYLKIYFTDYPSDSETSLNVGVLCNIGYPPETHLELKSRKISFVHNILLNNPIILIFCIRVRQYHCRALCKMPKRLDKWTISYGPTKFHDNWVGDDFRKDILYCTTPLNAGTTHAYPFFFQDSA